MAQNQEQLRHLESIRLAESMLYYPAEDDTQTVEARTAPAAADGVANLRDQIEGIPNLQNAERAAALAFGIAASTSRNRGKVMNLAKKADPTENTTIGYFQLDFTQNTWQGIVGTELQDGVNDADQRRFAKFPWKNDLQKDTVLKELLDYAFKHANQAAGPADGNAQAQAELNALRREQRTSILGAIANTNPAKHLNTFSDNLSRKIKNDMVRETNIATKNFDLVAAPVLGNKSFVEPETIRNISTSISNTPFGSMHNGKPLKHFLDIVVGVCNGTYNGKGAYQVLLHVLTGEPEELIRNHQSDGTDFQHAWSDLQAAFSNFGKTHDGIDDKIRSLLRTRPIDIHSTICRLKNLVRAKCMRIDSEAERKIVTNYQTTESIFSLLRTWYPSHLIQIKEKFDRINSNAKAQGYEPRPSPILLAQLVQELIRNEPALHQRAAEVNAITEMGDGFEISEASLAKETKGYLASNTKSAHVHSLQMQGNFQQRQQGQQGQQGQNSYQGFNKSPSLYIPEHLRGKCLKCGDSGHRMRDCPKYPKERIGKEECRYCRALHTSDCKSINVQELQAQSEAYDKEDAQAYAAACGKSPSENL